MTSAQRWGWGLLATLVTLSIVFLLMLEADATGCYGRTKCGTITTTTTSTTLPPSSTTTIPQETTTSTEGPSSTSTTIISTTTTSTLPVSTTTVPTDSTTSTTLIEATWTGSSTCQLLTSDWDEGISQVDVWMRDAFGDFGPADGIVPFTQPGTVDTGIEAEWILIPVTLTGYVAVPDQISLFTSECTPGPSTTVDPPITVTSLPELPLTGSNTNALIFAAVVLSVLGFMVVKEAGRE